MEPEKAIPAHAGRVGKKELAVSKNASAAAQSLAAMHSPEAERMSQGADRASRNQATKDLKFETLTIAEPTKNTHVPDSSGEGAENENITKLEEQIRQANYKEKLARPTFEPEPELEEETGKKGRRKYRFHTGWDSLLEGQHTICQKAEDILVDRVATKSYNKSLRAKAESKRFRGLIINLDRDYIHKKDSKDKKANGILLDITRINDDE